MKRPFHLVVLFLGVVGVLGCAAVLNAIRSGGMRTAAAAEVVFAKADDAWVAVSWGLAEMQARVGDLTLAANDVRQVVEEWAQGAAGRQVAAHLELGEKSARMASALGEADRWLERMSWSAEWARQILVLARPDAAAVLGADMRVKDEIESLRQRLAQAGEWNDRLNRFAAGGGMAGGTQAQEAVQMALRLLATFSAADARLVELQIRVPEIREETRRVGMKTKRWVFGIATSLALVMVWLAAGQFALAGYGWKGFK